MPAALKQDTLRNERTTPAAQQCNMHSTADTMHDVGN
jgi:hypothetical protein